MYENLKHEENKKRSRKSPLSVVRILVLLLIVFIAVAAVALIRGQIIEVRTYSVSAREAGKVKIVALSDLHGQKYGKDQTRIVSRIRKEEPDLIVYLGDMVERTKARESVEPVVTLTEQLAEIAPICYVDGNHEQTVRDNEPDIYEELNRRLADAGAVQLDNETVELTIDDADTVIQLCGISTHYVWEEQEYAIVSDLNKREGLKVLLCHYPETVLWYRPFDDGGLDLALCGHTHGGYAMIPFRGGLYAPEWGLWPLYYQGEYPVYTDTGWRRSGGADGAEYLGMMIISGGLAGGHGIPRINNPMEISVVELGR